MSTSVPNTFHWADYLVLGLFLCVSASMGIFVGYLNRKKKADTKDFLTGGGDMHYLPVALSLTASFMSSIVVISIPAEIFVYGSTYTFLAISYFFGFTFAGHVHLPIFHRLGITSGYQYLEMRFSRSVRLAGSITFSVMMFLYSGVVLYTPAVALSQASGIETYITILLVGGVVTFYTAMGGLKATIWNDALQVSVIIFNFVLIIIFGSLDSDVGGFDRALRVAKEDKLDKLYDSKTYSLDPFVRTSFWTQSVGGTFMHIVLYSASQTVIQKFISVKSITKAQIAVWISAVMSAILMVFVFFIGCIIYAKYQDCDPLHSGDVEKIDQIMSLFVLDIMGDLHGLPGLFLAAAFSATLSTVSGGLNAMAAVYLEDFISPAYQHFKGKPLGESIARPVTRFLAILFGLLTIAMAFLSEVMGDVAVQIALSVFGMVGAPLCGILSLGMFFPCVNEWGALSGLFCGLVLTLWIGIGPIVEGVPNEQHWKNNTGCIFDIPNGTATTVSPIDMTTTEAPEFLKIYELSYVYYSLFAILVAFIVGLTISVITGGNKDPKKLDPRLYYFFQDENHVGCCCSYKSRSRCRCGVPMKEDHEDDEVITAYGVTEFPKDGVQIGHKEDTPYTKSEFNTIEIWKEPSVISNGHAFENPGFTRDISGDTTETSQQLELEQFPQRDFKNDNIGNQYSLEEPVISTDL